MKVGKVVCGALACLTLLSSGCVSLDEHRRLQSANMALRGQNQALESDLFDQRALNDSLRTQSNAMQSQLDAKNALVANLQRENDQLSETARTVQATLEEMAGKYQPGDIAIVGPKLPQELDSALKSFASAHGNAVAYDPITGTVKWKGDLLFALGSDVVVESAMAALSDFVQILNSPAASGFEAFVVGHTDTIPISHEATRLKHPTNWHLSTHRAISVGNALARNGYDWSRICVAGCGEQRPVASNETEQGRSLNRRVEIYLLPRGSIVAAGVQMGASSGG